MRKPLSPKPQEHFLTPSARRDSHLFGGLRIKRYPMTVIDRISKLKHPGTLHDFTWPQDLPEFGRYNLIYGWNGSGKTTISRLFRALEMQTAPANCEIEFSINGTVVRRSRFSADGPPCSGVQPRLRVGECLSDWRRRCTADFSTWRRQRRKAGAGRKTQG